MVWELKLHGFRLHVHVCACVCMCVSEQEREREREQAPDVKSIQEKVCDLSWLWMQDQMEKLIIKISTFHFFFNLLILLLKMIVPVGKGKRRKLHSCKVVFQLDSAFW